MIKPIVGITMGDAAGIGPEIIVKSLEAGKVYDYCLPLVIGNAEVMRKACDIAQVSWQINKIDDITKARFEYRIMDVLHYDNIQVERLRMGVVDEMAGRAAVVYTQEAGRMALEGKIDAMVSAPLNKEAMRKAGFNYEGQAQILAELCGSKNYAMMLILGKMRLVLFSTHVALREVCDLITKEKVLSLLKLVHDSLTFIGIAKPRIGVAALNPHGGEGGLFGSEEIKEIRPAIEAGIDTRGPISADNIFVRAKEGEFDVVIGMYHDQGNIAMKLIGFGSVVTLLIGLPIIRTSVGHGTAFDIAGKNLADYRNLEEAIIVAAQMAANTSKARET